MPSLRSRLLAILTTYGSARRFCIAYSGGVDSHVLLHALVSLEQEILATSLCAYHINHHLHERSNEWAQHCEAVCNDLSVKYEVIDVEAYPEKGESPEAKARLVRYRALEAVLKHGDLLLTAHHQDDQAETLLLQLFRGSGPKGLAAMPAHAHFGPAAIARPLLQFSRDEIHHYASTHELNWVDDPGNQTHRYDRNFLRHNVMPIIKNRWPSVAKTLSRSAAHCADATRILEEDARCQMKRLKGTAPGSLSVTALRALALPRRAIVLRYWLHSQGFRVPNMARFSSIDKSVILAHRDSSPVVSWPGCEVRRYRDNLYAINPLAIHDAGKRYPWKITDVLRIEGLGVLEAESAIGNGLGGECLQSKDLTVRFRQGGERCRPAGRAHAHSLKKLFQEYAIPPWERERVPLIYLGEKLIAVAGILVCDGFQTLENETGHVLRWRVYPLAVTLPINAKDINTSQTMIHY